jgi:heme A synthase
LLKETFEVDGRLAVTLKTLFLSPGKLTSEFLDGRRRTYTSPLRLYLAISISFFILAAWAAGSGLLLDPGQDPGFDAAVQARFLSDDLPRLMFILLPVFALLLKGVYRQRLYFDHLIFSLHLHSAAYVVFALILPLEEPAGEQIFHLILQLALFVYFLWYFVAAMRRVYRPSWAAVAFKSTAVLFIYGILLSVAIENTSNFLIIAD